MAVSGDMHIDAVAHPVWIFTQFALVSYRGLCPHSELLVRKYKSLPFLKTIPERSAELLPLSSKKLESIIVGDAGSTANK